MSEAPQLFESMVRDSLRPEIDLGVIQICDNDMLVFDQLKSKFPMNSWGIRWDRIPNTHLYSPSDRKVSFEEQLPTITDFLYRFADAANISQATIVIMTGDDLGVALKIPFRTLMDHLHPLLDLPEDAYIMTQDYEWCFSYTMEDD